MKTLKKIVDLLNEDDPAHKFSLVRTETFLGTLVSLYIDGEMILEDCYYTVLDRLRRIAKENCVDLE